MARPGTEGQGRLKNTVVKEGATIKITRDAAGAVTRSRSEERKQAAQEEGQ